MKVGDEVEAVILTLDRDERKTVSYTHLDVYKRQAIYTLLSPEKTVFSANPN